MKKLILLTICLALSSISIAQKRALQISNSETNKQVIIKENKRIKIMTTDGQKLSGRFAIEGENSLLIRNQTIAFTDIASIKRNPLLLSIFTSGVLIYVGAITVGIGAIIGVFVESSGFLLAIPGAAMIYGGIKSPNVLKNYSTTSKWSFQVIQLPE